MKILHFPQRPVAAPIGATRADVWRGRVREWLGRLAQRLNIPGAIQSVDVLDDATGYRISVTVGPSLTRLSIGERDFYFNRFSGRFDGTGSATRPSDCSRGATPVSAPFPTPQDSGSKW